MTLKRILQKVKSNCDNSLGIHPSFNSISDLALAYKEDGNFNFKLKKYRFAIANYTEGLKQKCGKPEIDASLYLNRAAAQFYLGNYR